MLEKLLILRGEKSHLIPWMILMVGALNVIFVGGKRRTFAVFISALRESFNDTSRTEFNWIGASYTGVAFIAMPIVTNLIIEKDRAYRRGMLIACCLVFMSCLTSSFIPTPTLLFLTHTVLHGLGSSLILSCTALVVGEYFDKDHRYHVLATTLVSGGPYGALIFGPIYGNMVESYGWRNSFRIIGVTFVFVTGLGAWAYLPKFANEYHVLPSNTAPQLEANNDPASSTTISTYITDEDLKRPSELNTLKKRPLWTVIPREHLRVNPQIYLWLIDRVLHTIVIYSLMMNLVEMMTSANHLTLARASTINLLFGLGESVTFTFGALFGDRLRGKLSLIYCLSTIASMCFLTLAIYAFSNVAFVLLLAFLVGTSIGVGNTCVYATAEEVMCIHGSIGFPATNMIAGVGLFLMPLFGGNVIDKHGYDSFFKIQTVLCAIRCVLLGSIVYLLHKKMKSECQTKEEENVEQHFIAPNSNEVAMGAVAEVDFSNPPPTTGNTGGYMYKM